VAPIRFIDTEYPLGSSQKATPSPSSEHIARVWMLQGALAWQAWLNASPTSNVGNLAVQIGGRSIGVPLGVWREHNTAALCVTVINTVLPN